MARLKVGTLVTTNKEKKMEYFGYWLQPNTLWETFKPGDVGVVQIAPIPSQLYPGHVFYWVEFVRPPLRAVLRCQLMDTEIQKFIGSPYLNEQDF